MHNAFACEQLSPAKIGLNCAFLIKEKSEIFQFHHFQTKTYSISNDLQIRFISLIFESYQVDDRYW